MVLLHPAATRVFRAEEDQHGRFELSHFVFVQGLTRQTTRQDTVQLRFIRFRKQHDVERMVRNFTAVSRKVVQTFGERRLQIGETTDIGVRHFGKLRHVVAKGRLFNVERFIRAPAWQHFDIKRGVFSDYRVVFQRINRIVSGTDHFHVHLLHDAARGEFILRQQLVALVPDLVSS
ncbi:hypothetical protein D3C72_1412850 [compost metagenome]